MSMCSFPALLSLCEYQASRKSLVKITSPVYNCRMVEVYTMDKIGSRAVQLWNCCLQPELPFLCYFNLVSKALSVCP